MKTAWIAEPKNRHFVHHLGRLPGAGVSADQRGMARPQGRHHDRHGAAVSRRSPGPRTPGWATCCSNHEAAHHRRESQDRARRGARVPGLPAEDALPAALADLKAREGVDRSRHPLHLQSRGNHRHHRRRVRSREPSSIPSWPTGKPSAATRIEPHLYRHEGRDAIHHLFRVAASLDSMVVGEPQILGQLKTAYAAAKDCGALVRLAGWPDDARLRRGQAGALRNRHRADGGLGQLRGGGTGAQDLRHRWPTAPS